MMMSDIKRILSVISVLDIFLIIFSLYKGGVLWLINSQAAFLSSLLVTSASYLSYKKRVLQKANDKEITYDERDELDKIDDRYELFEEEKEEEQKDFKEIIQEEKKRQKGFKNAFSNLKTTLPAILSPLRFFAYLFLIASFFYLNRHGELVIGAFLSGFFVVPAGVLLYSLFKN